MTNILDACTDNLIAKIDLIGKVCQLNHGPEVQSPPAVNYLCQYIGRENDTPDLYRIPICEECTAALYDEEWLLFYCITCFVDFISKCKCVIKKSEKNNTNY